MKKIPHLPLTRINCSYSTQPKCSIPTWGGYVVEQHAYFCVFVCHKNAQIAEYSKTPQMLTVYFWGYLK